MVQSIAIAIALEAVIMRDLHGIASYVIFRSKPPLLQPSTHTLAAAKLKKQLALTITMVFDTVSLVISFRSSTREMLQAKLCLTHVDVRQCIFSHKCSTAIAHAHVFQ